MFAMCRRGSAKGRSGGGNRMSHLGKPGLLGAPPIPGISLPTLRGGGSGRRAQGTSHPRPSVPGTRHGALFSSRPGPALPPWASRSQDLPSQGKRAAPKGLFSAVADKRHRAHTALRDGMAAPRKEGTDILETLTQGGVYCFAAGRVRPSLYCNLSLPR